MTTVDDSDAITMFWIRSERASKSPNPYDAPINTGYDEAAHAAGMRLTRISVDDVVVGTTEDAGASVRVRGALVAPDRAFFHTKLVTWPVDRYDYWRHLTTYAALSAAGFFTTVPVGLSLINNEKTLTALQRFGSEVSRLPSVRLCTRGYDRDHLDWCTASMRASDIDFPVVVKPASWGGGNGVFVASTIGELDAVLTWAAATELTVVIQPWLGRDVVDYRVHCLDGEPHSVLTRALRGDALAGNLAQGGTAEWTGMPDAVIAPARAVAREIGLPYLCVDFLRAGGRWWFSEIEVDGGPPDPDVNKVRFGSYRSRFDTFVSELRVGSAT
ncbi:ATP-grasp domain-containing protein [Streptomyces sp. 900105755]